MASGHQRHRSRYSGTVSRASARVRRTNHTGTVGDQIRLSLHNMCLYARRHPVAFESPTPTSESPIPVTYLDRNSQTFKVKYVIRGLGFDFPSLSVILET